MGARIQTCRWQRTWVGQARRRSVCRLRRYRHHRHGLRGAVGGYYWHHRVEFPGRSRLGYRARNCHRRGARYFRRREIHLERCRKARAVHGRGILWRLHGYSRHQLAICRPRARDDFRMRVHLKSRIRRCRGLGHHGRLAVRLRARLVLERIGLGLGSYRGGCRCNEEPRTSGARRHDGHVLVDCRDLRRYGYCSRRGRHRQSRPYREWRH